MQVKGQEVFVVGTWSVVELVLVSCWNWIGSDLAEGQLNMDAVEARPAASY